MWGSLMLAPTIHQISHNRAQFEQPLKYRARAHSMYGYDITVWTLANYDSDCKNMTVTSWIISYSVFVPWKKKHDNIIIIM